MRISSYRDLLSRYSTVCRQSWAERHESAPPARSASEIAFLPAHLELIESPVHPAPLWTARIIGALALGVIALGVFGHLDIVAIAPGKLVPDARVKIIQPATTGVVRSILIRDGMQVQSGQLLMELDPTQADADINRTTSALLDAELMAARAQALLEAQRTNRPPDVRRIADAPSERQKQTDDYADGIYKEYEAKIHSLRAELDKRQADLAATDAEIRKLQKTAPLARQQADDYKSLADDHLVSRHDYLEKEQNAISQAEELNAQGNRDRELAAAVEEQEADISGAVSGFRRQQLGDLGKAQETLSQASSDQTKAQVRQSRMRLIAPVSGTVQQLAVHTVGGVVTTAQNLLEIVPNDSLDVEARIENKDIGFVGPGQPAVIKIDAFPYTRFGYLRGSVESVSNDAVSNGKGGLYFVVRIRLPSKQFPVGQKRVILTPGMEVRAEIRTGRRSLGEYFFSPLLTTINESLHER